MALSDDDIARIMVSIPEPVSDSGKDVAVWATNLCLAIEAETRKQDEALIRQLVEALEVTASDVCQVAHHKKRDQHGNGDVCPVQARHDEAIAAGRARLEGKP